MTIFLRQSTASQEVLLGPFLDDTDGKTAETALTIANTDIKLWFWGGTTESNKNSGGATHIAGGRYYIVLDATDTATVGGLEINVHVSGALPVRKECWVLEEAVFDALFAASAAGYSTYAGGDTSGTTTLLSRIGTPSDLGGGATVAANLADIEAQTDDIGAAGAGLTALVDLVWDEALAGHTTAGTAGKALSDAGAAGDPWSTALPGAYVAGTAGYILGTNLNATVSSRSSHDAAAVVTAMGTGTFLTAIPWNTAWDAEVESEATDALVAMFTNAATLVDLVWDEALSGHTTAGTAGKALSDAGAAGDPWGTSLPGAYGAGTAGYILGTNLDTTVSGRPSAADIWSYGTRTLTNASNITSTGNQITLDGSGYVTFSNSVPSAADIWSYGTRILTAANNITSSAGVITLDGSGYVTFNNSIPSAADIWSYGTRTLTAASNITSTGNPIALDGNGYVTFNNNTVPSAADIWGWGTRTLTSASGITGTGGTITLDGSGYVTASNAPSTADIWSYGTRTLTSASGITSSGSTITLDGSGYVTASAVTGSVGSISGVTFPTNFSAIAVTADGIVDADVKKLGGSAPALDGLKNMSLAVAVGTVVADGSNTATSFKVDTTLGAKVADYFGGANGGMVLNFIAGTTNEYVGIRVASFDTTTDFITLESALPGGAPSAGETFVLLGRIEV